MTAISPIIIIGMHRSGTSMLCRILGDLGIFFGNDTSRVNTESSFFVEINRWLFEQCGASWDHPATVKDLFSQKNLYENCKDYVSLILESSYSANFIGSKIKGGVFSTSNLWGWKDPRNTYTLQLWLDLFPNAKIINVVRNGVDVANSLKVREESRLERKGQAIATGQLPRRKNIYRTKLSHQTMLKLVSSLRCLSLEGGFSLWEEYMDESHEYINRFNHHKSIEVCYEKLLIAPKETLGSVCKFCNIAPQRKCMETAIEGIRSDRANAYKTNHQLLTFAKENQERLARFNY